jgi:hypothetical protein
MTKRPLSASGVAAIQLRVPGAEPDHDVGDRHARGARTGAELRGVRERGARLVAEKSDDLRLKVHDQQGGVGAFQGDHVALSFR